MGPEAACLLLCELGGKRLFTNLLRSHSSTSLVKARRPVVIVDGLHFRKRFLRFDYRLDPLCKCGGIVRVLPAVWRPEFGADKGF